MGRGPRLVALIALAASTLLGSGCTQPAEDPAVVRVTALLADLGRDEATAPNAVAALAALGPADAAAVPVLMRALSCPPEPAPHASGDARHIQHAESPRDRDQHGHGGHAHGACNDHVVLAAAAGLATIGGPAVPPLLARLRDAAEPDRTFAGYAVSRLSPAAAPALLAAIDDPEPRVRMAVVGAIRGMQPPPSDALAPIAGRLRDADPEVRQHTADTLARFGGAAVPMLLAAFDDPDPRVRASVASALRSIGAPARDAAAALRDHLADPIAAVRLNAAAALPAIGADDAATIAALAALLADPEHTVRWSAAMALGRLGPAAAPARPALEDARHDPHPLVQRAAHDALTRLGSSAP